MTSKFQQLPMEKRRRILNAALQEFSTKDYKSANTDIIAARAGISKGSLFYYFKNKQSLYFTLVRYMAALVEREMQVQPADEGRDFFELLDELSVRKLPVLKAHPGLAEFSARVFYHSAMPAGPAVDRYLLRLTDELCNKYFAKVDTTRFRPECTPRQAIDLLMYLADGYLHAQMMAGKPLDIDAMYENYDIWQDMVRRYVYREEYL